MRHLIIVFISILFLNVSNAQIQDAVSIDGDPLIFESSDKISLKSLKAATLNSIDPGDSIEGDYVRGMTFFQNGQKMLVANFVTQNLTVIDWASQQPVADIPVSGNPAYVETFGNKAVVTLPLQDTTLIIDLVNYSVIDGIETKGEPNQIKIDEANNRALVASIDSQYCYVIDLNNNSLVSTIDSFYSSLQTFSFITSNNRSDFDYYDFALSKDGAKAISISHDGSGISVHDIASGNVDTTFNQISNPFAFAESDTNRVFVLNNSGTPCLYRIDLEQNIFDSISLSGLSIFTLCRGMAPNSNGEKVVLSMGGGMVSADFNSMSFSPLTNNTVFWLQPSYDYQYAIGGGFYTQVVNISSGILNGTYTGLTQTRGVASDSGYHFAGIDPLRKEYIHAFEINGPVLNLVADIPTGSNQEADAPYRVSISNDGKTVLVANQLSKSASIINVDSNRVEKLASGMTTGSFGCAMTSDGKYGLIADYEGFAVHVIHMESEQVVASPTVGDRPSIIRIAPGDTLALVTNTRGNTVSFIRLDSANSVKLSDLYVGVIGVSWTNQGIFSDLQIPESGGNFALLATSFDDDVKVINMLTRSIANTVPVGDFPSQIAISKNGPTAMVINKNENTVSLLNFQGAITSVLITSNTANNPTRISYDSIGDRFLVCNSGSQSVQFFDAQTGSLQSTVNFAPSYTPLQAEALKSGKIAYLLSASGSNSINALRVDGTDYPLPARPCFMDVSKNSERLVIAMSGPDYIGIFEGDSLIINDLKSQKKNRSISIYPNPVKDKMRLTLNGNRENIAYVITDLKGNLLHKGLKDNIREYIDVSHLKPGVYIIKLQDNFSSESQVFIKN